MAWTLNGEPAPRDPNNPGFLVINEQRIPVDWPRAELLALPGVTWVEPEAPQEPEPVAPTAEAICREIDAVRDARIDGGFDYLDHRFQSRASDRENIIALGADAAEAIRDGAVAGDYFWHPEFPQGFGFINEANVAVPMDAFQTKGLRARGTGFKAAQTFHARDLKDAVLAAENPASVEWRTGWPA